MKSAGRWFSVPLRRMSMTITSEQLYAAMNALPEKQRHRIYAYSILKISQSEIARIDSVDHCTVNISIRRGLRNLERYLKNIFWACPQLLQNLSRVVMTTSKRGGMTRGLEGHDKSQRLNDAGFH